MFTWFNNPTMVYVYKPKLVGGFNPVSISTVYHLYIWANTCTIPFKNMSSSIGIIIPSVWKNMHQTTNQLRSYASPLALKLWAPDIGSQTNARQQRQQPHGQIAMSRHRRTLPSSYVCFWPANCYMEEWCQSVEISNSIIFDIWNIPKNIIK